MEALAGAHPATLPILLALVLLCASAAVVPLLEVVPAAAAIGVVVASFVSAYVVALRWRKRRAARELARLRALPIPLDLPQYVDVLAGGHPEQGRVRVIVWFEAPPRAAVRDRLETRAREHGVPEIEWASNDEEIRLTSEFFGLRSHSDDGWDPKNAPIHKQTRRVLDHVLLPLRTEAPLRAVQVRIV